MMRSLVVSKAVHNMLLINFSAMVKQSHKLKIKSIVKRNHVEIFLKYNLMHTSMFPLVLYSCVTCCLYEDLALCSCSL